MQLACLFISIMTIKFRKSYKNAKYKEWQKVTSEPDISNPMPGW